MSVLTDYDRAATVVQELLGDLTSRQYEAPTPCTGWNVRQLLDHLVRGQLWTNAVLNGRPLPDRSVDRLGADPAAAFAAAVATTRTVFAAPGMLERITSTPYGDLPGTTIVQMRIHEFLVHGWDLARATGRSTDLEPELASAALQQLQTRMVGKPRDPSAFAAEQPAPPTATAADRLAAYLGRQVT
ncbi:TIGR03086 family metal-binding protein [Stackebrandtia soli]|uniref:TIGR03086 family metal-binding protein n=1 Tax=Stackebrandtia soli TaxID=1892856 RepID=UPI0039ECEDEC